MLDRGSEGWDGLTGPSGLSGRRIIDAIYALQEEGYIEDNAGQSLGFAEVFNQLCHQGTIYELTYAATPHLLPAATGETCLPAMNALILLAEINLSYNSTGFPPPDIPLDFKDAFETALKRAKDMALQHLNQSVLASEDFNLCLMAMTGLHNLSDTKTIIEQTFFDQGLVGTCEHCFADVEILCGSGPFSVQWVEPHPKHPKVIYGQPKGPITYVTSKRLLESGWNWKIETENAENWLAHFAICADQTETKEGLTFLFGDYECPKCAKPQSPWFASLNERRAQAR